MLGRRSAKNAPACRRNRTVFHCLVRDHGAGVNAVLDSPVELPREASRLSGCGSNVVRKCPKGSCRGEHSSNNWAKSAGRSLLGEACLVVERTPLFSIFDRCGAVLTKCRCQILRCQGLRC